MDERLLSCHARGATDVITRFTASVERDGDNGLRFRYVLHGAIERIALPARAESRHTDDLWRHTCFEAFISTEDDRGYVECNFSPSGAWATYRFSRYRSGMTPWVAEFFPDSAPRITLQQQADSLTLDARLRLGTFANQPLRIGLTAVIEDRTGNHSYWALHHPRSKPDFHHRAGFILRLAAP